MHESLVLTTGDGDLDEPGAYHRLLHQGLGSWEVMTMVALMVIEWWFKDDLMGSNYWKWWFNMVIVEWEQMPIGKIWAGNFRS